MPRFPQKHAPVLFAVMMSCLMTFVVTCLVTLVNTGLDAGFMRRWIRAFTLAWPVACVCILLFAGRVRRVVALLIPH